jgi:hypothetical protein
MILVYGSIHGDLTQHGSRCHRALFSSEAGAALDMTEPRAIWANGQ